MGITSYHKLPLHKGIAIEKLNDREWDMPIDREIALLSILNDKPIEYYESMPLRKLTKLIKGTGWLAKMPEGKTFTPFVKWPYVYKFRMSPAEISKDDFFILNELSVEEANDNLHKKLSILTTKVHIITGREAVIKNAQEEYESRAALFYNKMSYGLAATYGIFFLDYYPNIFTAGLAYFQGLEKGAREYLKTINPEKSPTAP